MLKIHVTLVGGGVETGEINDTAILRELERKIVVK
jgi:ADP-ribose pyrophosphatase YjhB (NUDIX family)